MAASSTLTLTRLRAHVAQILQGGTVPTQFDQDDIINDAGRFFYSAHPWRFRERPPVSLSITGSQSWVELPENFGELAAWQSSTTTAYGFQMTTPQTIADMRSSNISVASNDYWGAIVQPSQPSRKLPMPPPRIEIWPTPASDVADLITLWYRADWTDMAAPSGDSVPDDVADVPRYAESALIECVRGFVLGWSERLMEPKGGIGFILESIIKGPIWRMATGADQRVQSSWGPLRGGAIEMMHSGFDWRAASGTVSDPA